MEKKKVGRPSKEFLEVQDKSKKLLHYSYIILFFAIFLSCYMYLGKPIDQYLKCIETIKLRTEVEKSNPIKITNNFSAISVGKTLKINIGKQNGVTDIGTVSYSSSDPNILSVDKNGNIYGIKGGTVYLYIKTSKGYSITKKISVTNTYKIHFIHTSTPAQDSILLESNGLYAMIDTGMNRDYAELKAYLQKIGVKKLEFIMITHNHEDHCGSTEQVLRDFPTKKLFLKEYLANDKEVDKAYSYEANAKNIKRYNGYINMAKQKGTTIKFVEQYFDGKVTGVGDMVIKMYNIENRMAKGSKYSKATTENINSITQLVKINNHRVYLEGDLSENTIANDIADIVKHVDVYKMGHHGNGNSTTEYAAKKLNPYYAVATTSRDRILDYKALKKIKVASNLKGVYFSGEKNVVVDLSSDEITVSGNLIKTKDLPTEK